MDLISVEATRALIDATLAELKRKPDQYRLVEVRSANRHAASPDGREEASFRRRRDLGVEAFGGVGGRVDSSRVVTKSRESRSASAPGSDTRAVPANGIDNGITNGIRSSELAQRKRKLGSVARESESLSENQLTFRDPGAAPPTGIARRLPQVDGINGRGTSVLGLEMRKFHRDVVSPGSEAPQGFGLGQQGSSGESHASDAEADQIISVLFVVQPSVGSSSSSRGEGSAAGTEN